MMPTPPYDKSRAKQLFQKIEFWLKKGYAPCGVTPHRGYVTALRKAGDELGIARSNQNTALLASIRVLGKNPKWDAYKKPEVEANPELVTVAYDERTRLNDTIKILRSQCLDLQRQINSENDLRTAVFGLSRMSLETPKWMLSPPSRGQAPEVPILFTSDFQWGETVAPNEIDGINAFNIDIARRRYRYLIDRAIHLCMHRNTATDYPGLILLRGGDSLSGDIHQELRETNNPPTIPALLDLAAEEIRGIELLADAFGKVAVFSVPGNHGRTTFKPVAKRYVMTNYEHILAWSIERHFKTKGDTRVEFITPESGDAYFRIFGWRFLLTHGDRIGSRGGQGFIGPAATISRGIHKTRQQYASMGKPVDWVMIGHFHCPLEIEHGFSNGCLPGFSEYALMLRISPEAPSQWLLFVDQTWGVTTRRKIFLEKPMIERAGPWCEISQG